MHKAAARALIDKGTEVFTLGMVSADSLYYAIGKFGFSGGIIISSPINTNEITGIKFFGEKGIPVPSEVLRDTFEKSDVVAPADILSKEIDIKPQTYLQEYTNDILHSVKEKEIRPFRLVADCGNGMAGANVQAVLDKLLQIQYYAMNFEPNEHFPHHDAYPEMKDNTKALGQMVVKQHADFGVSFDAEGVRCSFVDEKGEFIPIYILNALFARHYLQKHQGGKITYDGKLDYALNDVVNEFGGNLIIAGSGSYNFYKAMSDMHIGFGAEINHKFYFESSNYRENAEVPILYMLEILSRDRRKLSEITKEYQDKYFVAEEANYYLMQGERFQELYDLLKQQFNNGEINEEAGLTVRYDNWRFNFRRRYNTNFVQLNLEAKAADVLKSKFEMLQETLVKYGKFTGKVSRVLQIRDLEKTTYEKYQELLSNLWFSWNPHYIMPLLDLYGDGWRKNSPPAVVMANYGSKKLAQILEDKSWEIDQNLRLFHKYLLQEDTWFARYLANNPANSVLKIIQKKPIAYFCMEYGLIDWLQIYSGGLGVLAGDFLKQASDMGVPLVAVGLFYHQGYFHQDFDQFGFQIETYITQNPSDYPMELLKKPDGQSLEVSVDLAGHPVYIRFWQLSIGKTKLFMLDSNYEKNAVWEDRMISAHLYGGDQDTRIRQEKLLAIGGLQLLKELQVEPSIYHMNEGHSGFLLFELAKNLVNNEGLKFDEAIVKAGKKVIFTNHTLKEAGNDIFPFELIAKYFTSLAEAAGTDIENLFSKGKDEHFAKGKFSMTTFCLRYSAKANAVSKLHGQAAKRLWPDFQLLPITNGVHMPTWVAPELHALLDKYVSENWHYPEISVDFERIKNIPDIELWQAHLIRKQKLIGTLNRQLGLHLDPLALTIAWSRRLTEYKRPDLILSDLDRLLKVISNPNMPVQIIIAGKAHPKDLIGKDLLQKMNFKLTAERFHNKVVIVPGYNWQLARRMVSGSDVWLNTPYRYEEASGTSGMKACANGIIQLTTLDGWTDEVNWYKVGWVVDEKEPAKSLHDTLEYQIIPQFFDHNPEGFNVYWVEMMRNSMLLAHKDYSTLRMLLQYLQELYLPVIREN